MACKETTTVYNIILFDCYELHPLCVSCINSSKLRYCPVHHYQEENKDNIELNYFSNYTEFIEVAKTKQLYLLSTEQ